MPRRAAAPYILEDGHRRREGRWRGQRAGRVVDGGLARHEAAHLELRLVVAGREGHGGRRDRGDGAVAGAERDGAVGGEGAVGEDGGLEGGARRDLDVGEREAEGGRR